MNDKLLYQRIRINTLILMALVSVLSFIIFGHFTTYGIGVILGALVGIVSLNMIIKMTDALSVGNASTKARLNYFLRILVVAGVFGIAMYQGVSIFALLVGYLLSKLAIYYESFKNKVPNK